MRKVSTKAALISILILSSLLNVLPNLAPNANATSDYDEILELTNSLHLSRNGTTQGSPPCSPVDITTEWVNILNDDSAWWSGAQYIGGATRENTQEDFAAAIANGSGWAVSEIQYSNMSTTGTGIQGIGDAVRIVFSPSATSYTDFAIYYGQPYMAMRTAVNAPVYAVIIQFHTPNPSGSLNACTPQVVQSIRDSGTGSTFLENRAVAARPSDDGYTVKPLFVNTPIIYPSGYEGTIVPSNDFDNDNLSAAVENIQGSSDNSTDTDGDGLGDFIESQWNPNRDSIFCSTECAYPNPVKKDIYVEVDWMDSGLMSYKPTSTQINLVKNAFVDKNISLHVDTGQYGGGNELPIYISELKFEPTLGEIDFFNLKNGDEMYNANFLESRRGIWHYLISGYKQNVSNSNAATGAAYAGDDDAFIAIGRVKELVSPNNEDTAIAGTIIHELGHNLCLSDTSYIGQDSSCLFAGVDHSAGNNYASSMNYDKQLTLVDYSEGVNSMGDHDDWSAILTGMDDFVTLGEDPMEGAFRGNSLFNKRPLY